MTTNNYIDWKEEFLICENFDSQIKFDGYYSLKDFRYFVSLPEPITSKLIIAKFPIFNIDLNVNYQIGVANRHYKEIIINKNNEEIDFTKYHELLHLSIPPNKFLPKFDKKFKFDFDSSYNRYNIPNIIRHRMALIEFHVIILSCWHYNLYEMCNNILIQYSIMMKPTYIKYCCDEYIKAFNLIEV
jgi:hypothetical protein